MLEASKLRAVECHTADGWTRVHIGQLERGDVFRMFEPSGEQVIGHAGATEWLVAREASVEVDGHALRRPAVQELLAGLYVAVLGHLYDAPALAAHHDDIGRLQTAVLDAAEGRPFEPLPLPWPPVGARELAP